MTKPNVAFYLGYASLAAQNYGSELALIKLVNHLKKWYNIFIITFTPPIHIPGVRMITPGEYINMTFDCIVISRYINFYIHLPLRAPKVLIWLHDVTLQPFFNGVMLPANGRWLLESVICDGVVAQTQWHKAVFNEIYPSSADTGSIPTRVIGNGIDVNRFAITVPKVPYKFIWTSSPKRGLTYLLEVFPKIKEKYPESHLCIFRGREEFTPEQFATMERLSDYVHYNGGVSNDVVAQEFLQSEVWLYPTDFSETYCISALEAQAAGCLCICSDKAALGEVVGDRGILIHSEYGSEEYFQEMMEGLETLFEKKAEYSQKAREWGLKQDWSNRAEMWKELLPSLDDASSKEVATPKIPSSAMEVQLINLDRRPDRWNYVQSKIAPHLNGINRFPACDGQKVDLTEEITRIFSNRGYPQKNPYPGHNWRRGVIGCALSHYYLWKKAATLKHPLVVFEDDITLSDNFSTRFDMVMQYLTKNKGQWDLCFLGYLDDRPIYGDKEIAQVGDIHIHEFNSEPARRHGGGTHGYVVSPEGAQKLLGLVEKYGIPQPVDWFMIEMFGRCVGGDTCVSSSSESPLRALKCLPHLVEQLPGDTDIQRDFSQVR